MEEAAGKLAKVEGSPNGIAISGDNNTIQFELQQETLQAILEELKQLNQTLKAMGLKQ